MCISFMNNLSNAVECAYCAFRCSFDFQTRFRTLRTAVHARVKYVYSTLALTPQPIENIIIQCFRPDPKQNWKKQYQFCEKWKQLHSFIEIWTLEVDCQVDWTLSKSRTYERNLFQLSFIHFIVVLCLSDMRVFLSLLFCCDFQWWADVMPNANHCSNPVLAQLCHRSYIHLMSVTVCVSSVWDSCNILRCSNQVSMFPLGNLWAKAFYKHSIYFTENRMHKLYRYSP